MPSGKRQRAGHRARPLPAESSTDDTRHTSRGSGSPVAPYRREEEEYQRLTRPPAPRQHTDAHQLHSKAFARPRAEGNENQPAPASVAYQQSPVSLVSPAQSKVHHHQPERDTHRELQRRLQLMKGGNVQQAISRSDLDLLRGSSASASTLKSPLSTLGETETRSVSVLEDDDGETYPEHSHLHSDQRMQRLRELVTAMRGMRGSTPENPGQQQSHEGHDRHHGRNMDHLLDPKELRLLSHSLLSSSSCGISPDHTSRGDRRWSKDKTTGATALLLSSERANTPQRAEPLARSVHHAAVAPHLQPLSQQQASPHGSRETVSPPVVERETVVYTQGASSDSFGREIEIEMNFAGGAVARSSVSRGQPPLQSAIAQLNDAPYAMSSPSPSSVANAPSLSASLVPEHLGLPPPPSESELIRQALAAMERELEQKEVTPSLERPLDPEAALRQQQGLLQQWREQLAVADASAHPAHPQSFAASLSGTSLSGEEANLHQINVNRFGKQWLWCSQSNLSSSSNSTPRPASHTSALRWPVANITGIRLLATPSSVSTSDRTPSQEEGVLDVQGLLAGEVDPRVPTPTNNNNEEEEAPPSMPFFTEAAEAASTMLQLIHREMSKQQLVPSASPQPPAMTAPSASPGLNSSREGRVPPLEISSSPSGPSPKTKAVVSVRSSSTAAPPVSTAMEEAPQAAEGVAAPAPLSHDQDVPKEAAQNAGKGREEEEEGEEELDRPQPVTFQKCAAPASAETASPVKNTTLAMQEESRNSSSSSEVPEKPVLVLATKTAAAQGVPKPLPPALHASDVEEEVEDEESPVAELQSVLSQEEKERHQPLRRRPKRPPGWSNTSAVPVSKTAMVVKSRPRHEENDARISISPSPRPHPSDSVSPPSSILSPGHDEETEEASVVLLTVDKPPMVPGGHRRRTPRRPGGGSSFFPFRRSSSSSLEKENSVSLSGGEAKPNSPQGLSGSILLSSSSSSGGAAAGTSTSPNSSNATSFKMTVSTQTVRDVATQSEVEHRTTVQPASLDVAAGEAKTSPNSSSGDSAEAEMAFRPPRTAAQLSLKDAMARIGIPSPPPLVLPATPENTSATTPPSASEEHLRSPENKSASAVEMEDTGRSCAPQEEGLSQDVTHTRTESEDTSLLPAAQVQVQNTLDKDVRSSRTMGLAQLRKKWETERLAKEAVERRSSGTPPTVDEKRSPSPRDPLNVSSVQSPQDMSEAHLSSEGRGGKDLISLLFSTSDSPPPPSSSPGPDDGKDEHQNGGPHIPVRAGSNTTTVSVVSEAGSSREGNPLSLGSGDVEDAEEQGGSPLHATAARLASRKDPPSVNLKALLACGSEDVEEEEEEKEGTIILSGEDILEADRLMSDEEEPTIIISGEEIEEADRLTSELEAVAHSLGSSYLIAHTLQEDPHSGVTHTPDTLSLMNGDHRKRSDSSSLPLSHSGSSRSSDEVRALRDVVGRLQVEVLHLRESFTTERIAAPLMEMQHEFMAVLQQVRQAQLELQQQQHEFQVLAHSTSPTPSSMLDDAHDKENTNTVEEVEQDYAKGKAHPRLDMMLVGTKIGRPWHEQPLTDRSEKEQELQHVESLLVTAIKHLGGDPLQDPTISTFTAPPEEGLHHALQGSAGELQLSTSAITVRSDTTDGVQLPTPRQEPVTARLKPTDADEPGSERADTAQMEQERDVLLQQLQADLAMMKAEALKLEAQLQQTDAALGESEDGEQPCPAALPPPLTLPSSSPPQQMVFFPAADIYSHWPQGMAAFPPDLYAGLPGTLETPESETCRTAMEGVPPRASSAGSVAVVRDPTVSDTISAPVPNARPSTGAEASLSSEGSSVQLINHSASQSRSSFHDEDAVVMYPEPAVEPFPEDESDVDLEEEEDGETEDVALDASAAHSSAVSVVSAAQYPPRPHFLPPPTPFLSSSPSSGPPPARQQVVPTIPPPLSAPTPDSQVQPWETPLQQPLQQSIPETAPSPVVTPPLSHHTQQMAQSPPVVSSTPIAPESSTKVTPMSEVAPTGAMMLPPQPPSSLAPLPPTDHSMLHLQSAMNEVLAMQQEQQQKLHQMARLTREERLRIQFQHQRDTLKEDDDDQSDDEKSSYSNSAETTTTSMDDSDIFISQPHYVKEQTQMVLADEEGKWAEAEQQAQRVMSIPLVPPSKLSSSTLHPSEEVSLLRGASPTTSSSTMSESASEGGESLLDFNEDIAAQKQAAVEAVAKELEGHALMEKVRAEEEQRYSEQYAAFSAQMKLLQEELRHSVEYRQKIEFQAEDEQMTLAADHQQSVCKITGLLEELQLEQAQRESRMGREKEKEVEDFMDEGHTLEKQIQRLSKELLQLHGTIKTAVKARDEVLSAAAAQTEEARRQNAAEESTMGDLLHHLEDRLHHAQRQQQQFQREAVFLVEHASAEQEAEMRRLQVEMQELNHVVAMVNQSNPSSSAAPSSDTDDSEALEREVEAVPTAAVAAPGHVERMPAAEAVVLEEETLLSSTGAQSTVSSARESQRRVMVINSQKPPPTTIPPPSQPKKATAAHGSSSRSPTSNPSSQSIVVETAAEEPAESSFSKPFAPLQHVDEAAENASATATTNSTTVSKDSASLAKPHDEVRSPSKVKARTPNAGTNPVIISHCPEELWNDDQLPVPSILLRTPASALKSPPKREQRESKATVRSPSAESDTLSVSTRSSSSPSRRPLHRDEANATPGLPPASYGGRSDSTGSSVLSPWGLEHEHSGMSDHSPQAAGLDAEEEAAEQTTATRRLPTVRPPPVPVRCSKDEPQQLRASHGTTTTSIPVAVQRSAGRGSSLRRDTFEDDSSYLPSSGQTTARPKAHADPAEDPSASKAKRAPRRAPATKAVVPRIDVESELAPPYHGAIASTHPHPNRRAASPSPHPPRMAALRRSHTRRSSSVGSPGKVPAAPSRSSASTEPPPTPSPPPALQRLIQPELLERKMAEQRKRRQLSASEPSPYLQPVRFHMNQKKASPGPSRPRAKGPSHSPQAAQRGGGSGVSSAMASGARRAKVKSETPPSLRPGRGGAYVHSPSTVPGSLWASIQDGAPWDIQTVKLSTFQRSGTRSMGMAEEHEGLRSGSSSRSRSGSRHREEKAAALQQRYRVGDYKDKKSQRQHHRTSSSSLSHRGRSPASQLGRGGEGVIGDEDEDDDEGRRRHSAFSRTVLNPEPVQPSSQCPTSLFEMPSGENSNNTLNPGNNMHVNNTCSHHANSDSVHRSPVTPSSSSGGCAASRSANFTSAHRLSESNTSHPQLVQPLFSTGSMRSKRSLAMPTANDHLFCSSSNSNAFTLCGSSSTGGGPTPSFHPRPATSIASRDLSKQAAGCDQISSTAAGNTLQQQKPYEPSYRSRTSLAQKTSKREDVNPTTSMTATLHHTLIGVRCGSTPANSNGRRRSRSGSAGLSCTAVSPSRTNRVPDLDPSSHTVGSLLRSSTQSRLRSSSNDTHSPERCTGVAPIIPPSTAGSDPKRRLSATTNSSQSPQRNTVKPVLPPLSAEEVNNRSSSRAGHRSASTLLKLFTPTTDCGPPPVVHMRRESLTSTVPKTQVRTGPTAADPSCISVFPVSECPTTAHPVPCRMVYPLESSSPLTVPECHGGLTPTIGLPTASMASHTRSTSASSITLQLPPSAGLLSSTRQSQMEEAQYKGTTVSSHSALSTANEAWRREGSDPAQLQDSLRSPKLPPAPQAGLPSSRVPTVNSLSARWQQPVLDTALEPKESQNVPRGKRKKRHATPPSPGVDDHFEQVYRIHEMEELRCMFLQHATSKVSESDSTSALVLSPFQTPGLSSVPFTAVASSDGSIMARDPNSTSGNGNPSDHRQLYLSGGSALLLPPNERATQGSRASTSHSRRNGSKPAPMRNLQLEETSTCNGSLAASLAQSASHSLSSPFGVKTVSLRPDNSANRIPVKPACGDTGSMTTPNVIRKIPSFSNIPHNLASISEDFQSISSTLNGTGAEKSVRVVPQEATVESTNNISDEGPQPQQQITVQGDGDANALLTHLFCSSTASEDPVGQLQQHGLSIATSSLTVFDSYGVLENSQQSPGPHPGLIHANRLGAIGLKSLTAQNAIGEAGFSVRGATFTPSATHLGGDSLCGVVSDVYPPPSTRPSNPSGMPNRTSPARSSARTFLAAYIRRPATPPAQEEGDLGTPSLDLAQALRPLPPTCGFSVSSETWIPNSPCPYPSIGENLSSFCARSALDLDLSIPQVGASGHRSACTIQSYDSDLYMPSIGLSRRASQHPAPRSSSSSSQGSPLLYQQSAQLHSMQWAMQSKRRGNDSSPESASGNPSQPSPMQLFTCLDAMDPTHHTEGVAAAKKHPTTPPLVYATDSPASLSGQQPLTLGPPSTTTGGGSSSLQPTAPLSPNQRSSPRCFQAIDWYDAVARTPAPSPLCSPTDGEPQVITTTAVGSPVNPGSPLPVDCRLPIGSPIDDHEGPCSSPHVFPMEDGLVSLPLRPQDPLSDRPAVSEREGEMPDHPNLMAMSSTPPNTLVIPIGISGAEKIVDAALEVRRHQSTHTPQSHVTLQSTQCHFTPTLSSAGRTRSSPIHSFRRPMREGSSSWATGVPYRSPNPQSTGTTATSSTHQSTIVMVKPDGTFVLPAGGSEDPIPAAGSEPSIPPTCPPGMLARSFEGDPASAPRVSCQSALPPDSDLPVGDRRSSFCGPSPTIISTTTAGLTTTDGGSFIVEQPKKSSVVLETLEGEPVLGGGRREMWGDLQLCTNALDGVEGGPVVVRRSSGGMVVPEPPSTLGVHSLETLTPPIPPPTPSSVLEPHVVLTPHCRQLGRKLESADK